MCGILGVLNPDPEDFQKISKGLDSLRHRGPEAASVLTSQDGKVILGHCRLKILDLSDSANQPMVSANGKTLLAFNGEIVNYRKLKAGLQQAWKTSSDTEVLLSMWQREGEECLPKLAGMFAFALYDQRDSKVFLVRDRFGVKPLYYTLKGDQVYFSSEIPALLPFVQNVRPDEGVIRTFLEAGISDSGERTFFRGIHAVPPGSLVEIRLSEKKQSTRRWYPGPNPDFEFCHSDKTSLICEGRRLISQVVEEYCLADVEVGLNVSGGVDSTVLAGVALAKSESIKMFTQNYEKPYGEADWCRKASAGQQLFVTELDHEKILGLIKRAVRIQAEPFAGVPVIGYDPLYAQAAREGVTVLLDGNGVDESFLGYKKYHLTKVASETDARRKKREALDYSQAWGEPYPFAANALAHSAAIDGSSPVKPEALGVELGKVEPAPIAWPPRGEYKEQVRWEAAGDLLVSKIPRNLRFNDRMSMAHSRELRVPFLDHRLVEFACSIPVRFLLNRIGSKALFREIALAWTTEEIALARKRSVQTPQREWMAGPWKEWINQIFSSESFKSRGWINPEQATSHYRTFCMNGGSNSAAIWQWVNLELWARAFFP